MTQRRYQSGTDQKLDQFITLRYRDLLRLHGTWGYSCRRALDTKKPWTQLKSWQQYSQQEQGVNDSVQSLTNDTTKMNYLCGLNSGFALDIKSVHESRHLWYHEKIEYQMDCSLLLVKLLNNMRWCQMQEAPHLMQEKLGFPLMNYQLEYGPTYPSLGERFGKRDKQIVVHDGLHLIYFEIGLHGLMTGRLLSIV